jgi:spore coat polysaccharide biosynthesis protein SpsF
LAAEAAAMILGVIQARMGSSRLPGKVLADIEGAPMLGRQVERLRRARWLDALVLATSDQAADDPVADYAQGLGMTVVRGPLDDVLARFGLAVEAFPQATAVARMTADCPLADPLVLDALLEKLAASGADYINNTMPERTFPRGLDVEAASVAAFRTMLAEAADPYEREHVTPFLYRRPERFRIESLARAPSLGTLRWTVDYPEDLEFVRGVYAALYGAKPDFTTEDVAALSPNTSPLPVEA